MHKESLQDNINNSEPFDYLIIILEFKIALMIGIVQFYCNSDNELDCDSKHC